MMCIMFSENLTCQAVPFALQMLTCHDVYHFSENVKLLVNFSLIMMPNVTSELFTYNDV
jgi:hypothetical protein